MSTSATVADDFVDVEQPIVPQIEHAAERTVDNGPLGNLLGIYRNVQALTSCCSLALTKGVAGGRSLSSYTPCLHFLWHACALHLTLPQRLSSP